MVDTRIHPETGKTLRREVRPQIITVGNLSETVDVPGWYPADDSDPIHTGADLKASDEVFKRLRAKYAAHVKDVRKSLKLSQEEAGRIIGGGRRGFQKYESGKTPPSVATVGLIEVLHAYPAGLDILRGLHAPTVMSPKAKAARAVARSAKKPKTSSGTRRAAHT